jgi:hypothetical protein
MGFFNKKAQSKKQEAEAKAAPLTPDKSRDEEQSNEVLEDGDQEEGGFSKLWESISGMCGNSNDISDDWCNMKEGMAEI